MAEIIYDEYRIYRDGILDMELARDDHYADWMDDEFIHGDYFQEYVETKWRKYKYKDDIAMLLGKKGEDWVLVEESEWLRS